MDQPTEIIGIIPAAGKAERISPLPCSKELYPIRFELSGPDGSVRPKVVSQFLLDKMRLADIHKAFFIIREGKWDIPTYFRDGKNLNMHLGYLMMGLPYGVPFTVDQAYPFVNHSLVAFGFPDIIFQPDNIFIRLLTRLRESNAALVLALLPAPEPSKVDMVDVDVTGRVMAILSKPNRTDLHYTWVAAVWNPLFTNFIHDHLATLSCSTSLKKTSNIKQTFIELSMGEVIQAALLSDLCTEAVIFPGSSCLDIGTPENLLKAAVHENAY